LQSLFSLDLPPAVLLEADHAAALVGQTSVCLILKFKLAPKIKTDRLKPVLLKARPRPDTVGTRPAHWPPARSRLPGKSLRRGGGPCPGFRQAACKGFGRWNPIFERAPN